MKAKLNISALICHHQLLSKRD